MLLILGGHFKAAKTGHYNFAPTSLVRIICVMLNAISAYAKSSLDWSSIPLTFKNMALFDSVIKHNGYLP